MECKDFMSKTMEKSPLKFSLARNMSSLDPWFHSHLWICRRSDSVQASLRNSENLSWKGA